MTNLLILGSGGQLGLEFADLSLRYPTINCTFAKSSVVDVRKIVEIKDIVKKNHINFIINCAAYTAVDRAEEEKSTANDINNLAVGNIAKVAKDYGVGVVHISTDYVFDGTKRRPYSETDEPNPLSVYGQSKLEGELLLKSINPQNSIIIRTSWLFSQYGNNFVKTMLKLSKKSKSLKIVADQVGSPTSTYSLAQAILRAIPCLSNPVVETYHYANGGSCNWYDFAREIFKYENLKVRVTPITSQSFKAKAQRPEHSILDTTKFKKSFSQEITNWRDALHDVLEKLRRHT